jgi:hypothetical protein
MRTSYCRECEDLTVKIARHLSECNYFSAVELLLGMPTDGNPFSPARSNDKAASFDPLTTEDQQTG